jgi:hypothetical protein
MPIAPTIVINLVNAYSVWDRVGTQITKKTKIKMIARIISPSRACVGRERATEARSQAGDHRNIDGVALGDLCQSLASGAALDRLLALEFRSFGLRPNLTPAAWARLRPSPMIAASSLRLRGRALKAKSPVYMPWL